MGIETIIGGGNQFLVYGNQLRLKDFDADWNGAGQSNDAFFYMQAGSIADGITARETGSFHIGSIFLLQGSNGTVKNCTAKGKRPIRLNGANNICRNSMLQCTDATSSAVTMGGDGGMIDSCIITSSDGGGINASAYGWNGFRGFYVKRTIINDCQSYGLLMGSTVTLNSTPELTSCIFANINGLGIDYGGMSLVNLAAVGFYAQDCGFYNNTSGNVTSGFESLLDNAVSCTADPFYDSASGDFNLSNTAGGGEALRASNKLIGN